jgi:hypothetical protein
VVHGEEDQSLAFCQLLKDEGYDAMVPRVGETLAINRGIRKTGTSTSSVLILANILTSRVLTVIAMSDGPHRQFVSFLEKPGFHLSPLPHGTG